MGKIKNVLYSVIERILPEAVFQKLWAYYVKNNAKFDEDRYKYSYVLSSKWGKKQYFVFRYRFGYMGMIAVAKNAIMSCEWAEKHKMIPIIDYEWGYIYEENNLGLDNVWEYIFEQDKPIKQVLKEDNVIVGYMEENYSDPDIRKELTNSEDGLWIRFADDNWREEYKKLNYYAHKWWRFREDILERFTQTYAQLFDSEMKILGVALREEFSFKRDEFKGTMLETHPHQMNIDEMIPVIKQYMQKWNCTHIFVTAQIEESIQICREEFGEALIATKRNRVKEYKEYKEARHVGEKYLYKSSRELYDWINGEDGYGRISKDSAWNKNSVIEYMEEIYGLSLCNCLLAGKSGGSFFACVWNGGKYEELEILPDDNGSQY